MELQYNWTHSLVFVCCRFAHAFMFDSGSTSGTIMGHSKVVNTVAIRQNRPFSVLTGGDDKGLVVSTAFPVKYKTTIQDHERYIQEVKFSHDGEMFATVGSDGKVKKDAFFFFSFLALSISKV